MAKIKDDCLELELTPRRYQEMDDDPFILSIFELLENKKAIVRDFSAVLLESEYKLLISGIETLIMGNQDMIKKTEITALRLKLYLKVMLSLILICLRLPVMKKS